MIKYIKSVLWRIAKCLSYIEEARCLKFKHFSWKITDFELWHCCGKWAIYLNKLSLTTIPFIFLLVSRRNLLRFSTLQPLLDKMQGLTLALPTARLLTVNFYALLTVNFSNILFLVSNLMHHSFITFITFICMFRATLCSSSGGIIVYIQHLVLCMLPFLGDRSVHRHVEDSTCLCTERSPKKSDIQRTRCCMYTMNPPDDEHNIARNM